MSVDAPPELHGADRMSVRTRGFFFAAAKLPARLVVEALTAHVNEIGLLLDAIPDPGVRRRLLALRGESSYLVACCDIDLGDPAGALSGLKATGEAALQADDQALTAITFDGHSYFRAFTGNHWQALGLVQTGLEASRASDSLGTLAYMQLRAAEEHAALGQTAKAVRAWGQAEKLYAGTDLDTDRDWNLLWLTPDCFDSVRALFCFSTGCADDAVPVARALTTRLGGSLGKSGAVALVNVALARMIRDRRKLATSARAFINDVESTQRQLDGLQLNHPAR